MSDSSIVPPASSPGDVAASKPGESIANRVFSQNGNGAQHVDQPETCVTDKPTEATSTSSRVNQAEQTVDQFATKVASWTASLGKSIVWASSRVKEAAADFWAEAQNVRSGNQK